MPVKGLPNSDQRMIHVRLPEAIHKRVRVKAAQLDTSIQQWLLDLIVRELQSTKREKA